MSIRLISRAALAVALSAVPFQVALAADPAPAAPTTPTAPDAAPREGGPREGGPRGEGGRGGGRRGGGEGGPREGGPGGGPGGPGGGMFADETPEARRTRMLRPYLEMLPDLSVLQQNQVMAVLESSAAEVAALRANDALSEERRGVALRAIRGDVPKRIGYALNDAQLATYNAIIAEREETVAEMAKIGSVRPDEGLEEMRARLLTGYEDFMEELSVKQKTQIIKILEAAGEESATVQANTTLSATQKTDALRKIHDDVNTKVVPLLDAEQAASWKKAHTAKRP
ncbi:hypothetical protein EON83_20790 [bacterium]|nr:MAG: hypothetical protein EON83_20790 [bacterium]